MDSESTTESVNLKETKVPQDFIEIRIYDPEWRMGIRELPSESGIFLVLYRTDLGDVGMWFARYDSSLQKWFDVAKNEMLPSDHIVIGWDRIPRLPDWIRDYAFGQLFGPFPFIK